MTANPPWLRLRPPRGGKDARPTDTDWQIGQRSGQPGPPHSKRTRGSDSCTIRLRFEVILKFLPPSPWEGENRSSAQRHPAAPQPLRKHKLLEATKFSKLLPERKANQLKAKMAAVRWKASWSCPVGLASPSRARTPSTPAAVGLEGWGHGSTLNILAGVFSRLPAGPGPKLPQHGALTPISRPHRPPSAGTPAHQPSAQGAPPDAATLLPDPPTRLTLSLPSSLSCECV